MSDQALIISDNASLTISFSPKAQEAKEAALMKSALIGRVSNAEQNAKAAEAQAALADLRRAVEKARVEAKKPFLEAGKQIDAQAAAFVGEIEEEERRVMKESGDFHALEAAKARAEAERVRLEQEAIERRAREEAQRIFREEQERLAVIRRQEEAAAAKVAEEKAQREAAARRESDEAARKVREASNAKARAEAERQAEALRQQQAADAAKAAEQAERQRIELERQRELAAAQTHDALDAAQQRASEAQAAVVTTPTAPVRAAGQRVKTDLDVTVTDIWALARAHPGLVNIEPRMGEIKTLLQTGAKIAGVTFKEKFVPQTTTRRLPAAIEV